MLPIYVSYLTGGKDDKPGKALANAIGFVLGFTAAFVTLGAFAGSIGRLLIAHGTAVNIIIGSLIIIFGLGYTGLFNLPGFCRGRPARLKDKPLNFLSAIVFGWVFAMGWTPCVSAFLGAALLRASQQGSMLEGMLMLFVFSMGLGIPFIASALLIDKLKNAFAFIKRHYRVINIASGLLLVLIGILMITGLFGRFMNIFV